MIRFLHNVLFDPIDGPGRVATLTIGDATALRRKRMTERRERTRC